METENFKAIDLEREYLNTLRASRVAATVVLFLSAGWMGRLYIGALVGLDILENTVTGGLRAMPGLTELFVNYGKEAFAVCSLAAFGAVLYIWIAGRSLSRVILATTIGAGICLMTGLFIQLAFTQPLIIPLTTAP